MSAPVKPLIVFVDDEPQNLTVFEASLPDHLTVRTFQRPLKALEALQTLSPWVIVSDQRMPDLTGVAFLELTRTMHPNAVRIIVTGYSDEDLVVESVRKAQIFDYIRKPWEQEDLESSMLRAVEYYRKSEEARQLLLELRKREEELAEQNRLLMKATSDLTNALARAEASRSELESWAPPFILESLAEGGLTFPIERDIVVICSDVVRSSELHGRLVNGQPVRKEFIRKLSELLLSNGGWRESHAGDSVYGHFGLRRSADTPAESALATAREFRVALRGLAEKTGLPFECGIALHIAPKSVVDIHTVNYVSGGRSVTLKSFDTSSIDIDVLHRMEKLSHLLPGSNIVMSEDFVDTLRKRPANLVRLGEALFKGQRRAIMLYLVPSDQVKEADIEALLKDPCFSPETLIKAA